MSEDKKEIPDLFDGVEERTKDNDENKSILKPEDRPRGVLSKVDREYLCGLKDYEHKQSEANRKQDIRKRIENALKDFTLLWFLLESEELDKVFKKLGEETVDQSIESMITFSYLGLDGNIPRLENRLERAILLGENLREKERSAGEATNVDVSIDINYDPDIDLLYNKLNEGEPDQLTPEEIGILVKSGKLEPEDLAELEESDSSFPGVYIGGDKYIGRK